MANRKLIIDTQVSSQNDWHLSVALYLYSSVPNKCVGWNKRDGRKKSQNLINVLDGINVMEGKSHKI